MAQASGGNAAALARGVGRWPPSSGTSWRSAPVHSGGCERAIYTPWHEAFFGREKWSLPTPPSESTLLEPQIQFLCVSKNKHLPSACWAPGTASAGAAALRVRDGTSSRHRWRNRLWEGPWPAGVTQRVAKERARDPSACLVPESVRPSPPFAHFLVTFTEVFAPIRRLALGSSCVTIALISI